MTDRDALVAAIRNERERHRNLGPQQMVFNIRCTCGHVGQHVSERGEFDRHVDEAVADTVLALASGDKRAYDTAVSQVEAEMDTRIAAEAKLRAAKALRDELLSFNLGHGDYKSSGRMLAAALEDPDYPEGYTP